MAKKKTASKSGSSTNGKKISKTEAIRNALRQSADGSPSEVAEKLNKQGIKVTAQYVSTIKANDKRRAESGAPRRKPGRPAGTGKATAVKATASSSASTDDLKEASELMLHAVELVLRAGAKEAKQLIQVAEGMVAKIADKR